MPKKKAQIKVPSGVLAQKKGARWSRSPQEKKRRSSPPLKSVVWKTRLIYPRPRLFSGLPFNTFGGVKPFFCCGASAFLKKSKWRDRENQACRISPHALPWFIVFPHTLSIWFVSLTSKDFLCF
jgi:hypothetical protein